jgi:hypothetical protein
MTFTATLERKASDPVQKINKSEGTMIFHLRSRVCTFQETDICKTKTTRVKIFVSSQAKQNLTPNRKIGGFISN